jgi:hypothetical protein
MKAIQKFNSETGKWELICQSYCGLSKDEAKKEIKQLRDWAKDDNSDTKYRITNVTLTPR